MMGTTEHVESQDDKQPIIFFFFCRNSDFKMKETDVKQSLYAILSLAPILPSCLTTHRKTLLLSLAFLNQKQKRKKKKKLALKTTIYIVRKG